MAQPYWDRSFQLAKKLWTVVYLHMPFSFLREIFQFIMSYSSIKSNWFTIQNFASLSSFCLHSNCVPLHGRLISLTCIHILMESCSLQLLGARKDGAQLPLVNKTTMYISSHHPNSASFAGLVQTQFIAHAASVVAALLFWLLFQPL